jgi:hypothetical protein
VPAERASEIGTPLRPDAYRRSAGRATIPAAYCIKAGVGHYGLPMIPAAFGFDWREQSARLPLCPTALRAASISETRGFVRLLGSIGLCRPVASPGRGRVRGSTEHEARLAQGDRSGEHGFVRSAKRPAGGRAGVAVFHRIAHCGGSSHCPGFLRILGLIGISTGSGWSRLAHSVSIRGAKRRR